MVTEKARGQIQALYDAMQEQNKKKPPVSLSNINTCTWLEVQSTAKLTIRIVGNLSTFKSKEAVPAFAWDNRTETAQSDRCNWFLVLPIGLASTAACSKVAGVVYYNLFSVIG